MSQVMTVNEGQTWTASPVHAVDRFADLTFGTGRTVLVSFGVATRHQDNSDILTSRRVQQRVLDILDEPPSL